jgi:hypothetical protein
MKKVILLFTLPAIVFSSCIKGIDSSPKTLSQQASDGYAATAATVNTTIFGAMTTGKHTLAEKESIYKNLGVNYIRYTIVLDSWTGSDRGFEKYTNDGYHIILNINEHLQPAKGGNPLPFTKDTVAYKKKLAAVLNKYKPEVVVIENEETNQIYHYGSMVDYINMLKAATTVAHARGIKISDGGIHPRAICYFIWQRYTQNSRIVQATTWMDSTMDMQMQYAAKHPEKTDNTIRIYWNRVDTLLNAFKDMNIDYVNLHIYEAINNVGTGYITIPGCITTMAQYVRQRTGKPVMSNECGQHNSYPTCVTTMMQAFVDGVYKYAIWYNGEGNHAVALINSDGTLRSNGEAFKTFMSTY